MMPPFAAVQRTVSAGIIACALTVTQADVARAAEACKGAAEHLAGLVKTRWPSSGENTPGLSSDMLGTITHASPPGFIPGVKRLTVSPYTPKAFIAQAARLPNPFMPSRQLLKALDDVQGELVITDLPGTHLLAANSIGGTARCIATAFFTVANARAYFVPGPKGDEDDVGGSCGLHRSFASVDGVPFIIDDSLNAGPSLDASLTLTPWENGKWQQPCEADFVFAPHFDPNKTLNDWPSLNNWQANDCGSAGCAGFAMMALTLVKQAQQDRTGTEARLLAALTVPQRDEYQKIKRAADRPDPDDALADGDDAAKSRTAAALTDSAPLLLPMLVGDHVFLASVGHFTIGWRVFADWKVTVETADGDKVREIARFAVGMTPGPIASLTIKLSPERPQ